MSTSVEEPITSPLEGEVGAQGAPGGGRTPAHTEVIDTEQAPAPPLHLLMAAAFASAAAAGWMLGGIFRGIAPRFVCLAAVALGVLWTWQALRTSRSVIVQALLVPVALAAGALTALPAGNGTTLPEAISQALQNGGLLEPPVPFDPGYRFLAVPLLVLIAGGTASLVASGWRPRLGLMLPLPMVGATALIQDPSAELFSGAVALVLLAAALMLYSHAEIRGMAEVTRGFEVRRTLRGGAAIAAALVILGALNQAGFLFPQPVRSRVAEPQKPQVVSITQIKDHPLFLAKTSSPGPWRVGVLDVYQDNGFLLPPYDTSRFKSLPSSGKVRSYAGSTQKVTFVMEQPGGHSLPLFGDPVRIETSSGTISFDPRTQSARVVDFIPPNGYQVVVEAPVAPSGDQLESAGAGRPPLCSCREVPPPPLPVQQLLGGAPKAPWERLQFLRQQLYTKVVASGAGTPVDVAPGRVAAMLAGAKATPYEITAAEVMLARWAGLPARIAYGYYGGRKVKGGYEIHPQDGANWLEVYFSGWGWVSVYGVPPRAQATLTNTVHKQVAIKPSQDINVEAYIPIALDNPLFLYEIIQYWLLMAAGPVLALALALVFFPYPLKLLRARRRRRWARRQGNAEQIAVEYAELRDLATDLNAPGRWDTPLEFLDRIDEDPEHEDLAWLVTRALWGDLQRDLQAGDVAAAATLGRSVRRRLASAQPALTRVIAAASRASLREPYDATLPNTWPKAPAAPSMKQARRFGAAAAAAALLSSCAGATSATGGDWVPTPPARLPARLVPADLQGYRVVEETKAEQVYKAAGQRALVSGGRMFSLHGGPNVKGLLQVEVFKPRYSVLDLRLRRGVRDGIGDGHFIYYRVNGVWVGEQSSSDEVIYVWFAETLDVFEVLTVRSDVAERKLMVAQLLAYQGLSR